MKKFALFCLFCASLMAKDMTLQGTIVSTHDEAGGGYGIQTKKGVYGLCYLWDNKTMVNQLSGLESSGNSVQITGKQTDKWNLSCDTLKISRK